MHRSRQRDHAQPRHISRWARIKAKLCSYSCGLIHHQVTHSTDSPWSRRGNCRSINGGHSYCSFMWLNPTSTWLTSYSFYFLFNPSFLIITHLVLFVVLLLMNPYQLHPYVSFSFPFCIPDSHALSLCFLSTIALFLYHIVSSVVWRNVYKDSLCPFPSKNKKNTDKFRLVQSKSNPVYHQLCKPR